MNWISYDEYKLMDKFYKEQEAKWKEWCGFQHDLVGDYFKIEYISVIDNRKIIFYTSRDEKTKL